MSKSYTFISTTKEDQKRQIEEKHKMRMFGSTRFLEKSAWMFVGACKRGWYKLRMNLNF